MTRPRRTVVVAALLAVVTLALATGLRIWSSRSRGPADVVLITIDTLRADHIGCYGSALASTPVLDALAANGTRFADVIAPVPLTLPAHASILTGTTPLTHGVHDNAGFVLPASLPTLAERFQQAGYDTAAFVSGFPLDRRFGLARGFGVYDDRMTTGGTRARPAAVERRADETVAAATLWIRKPRTDGRPLFVWVHLFDPHAPYDSPEPFRSRFAQQPYDGEVAFADAQVGVLLAALSGARTARPTLVAVTADHGEGLGDHREPTHGLFVYDSTLRVPLIVAGRGVAAGHVVSTGAQLIDVAPTLLALAGLSPLPGAEGVALAGLSRNTARIGPRAAYAESLFGQLCCGWAPLHAWRDGRWMFIDAPRIELYDLAVDPGQLRNVAGDHPADVERLHHALDTARSQARTPDRLASTASDTRDRLRNLGYAAGSAGSPKGSRRDPKDVIELSTQLGRAVDVEDVDPEKAAAILEGVLRHDPENVLARRHLAMALMGQHRHVDALRVLRGLAADGDTSVETSSLLADLAIARGDFAAARSRLESLSSLQRDDMSVAFKLALVLARLGETERAISLLAMVVEREPGNVDALVDLGGALLHAGRPAEAAGYFEKAIAGGAPGALPPNGLGFAKLQLRDREGAIDAFRRSLRIDPNQPEIKAALRQAESRTREP